jgi:5-methylcytosine-specific restriction endonuclease McrA
MADQAPQHDLSKQVFGLWTVLGKAQNRGEKTAWVCACMCGTIRDVRTEHLRNGRSISCGCQRRLSLLEANRLRPYEALYNALVLSARKAGHDLNISYDAFIEFTKISECHYCGACLSWAEYSPQKNGGKKYQLDRKNNDLGYILDNVVVCCTTCNRAKGNRYTYDEWVAMTNALKTFRALRRGAHA